MWLLPAAGAIAIVAVTILQLRRDENSQTTSKFHVAGGPGTATSGTLFNGDRVRVYQGQLLLQQQPPATVGSNPAGGRQLPGLQSAKWAVCTTIFKPSRQILDTLKLQGFAMVVVGDKGAAPFDLAAGNLVYLGVGEQEQLAQQHKGLLDLLPWKHFGRKNLGFLHAISHGAQMIWDFDDDNGLKLGVQPAVPGSDMYTLQVGPGCPAFNPYPLMGAPTTQGGPAAWPRGFPLNLIRQPCNHTLVPGNGSSVAVIQALADHEPDVDGIFRLTRDIPFTFHGGIKHTLIIPHCTLAPYNAQATLVLQPALFTQLLPVTVHGRVSDVWRSYIAQRLPWDVGYHIAFAPPWVVQMRNPHNALADMQSEEPLYYQSLALINRLRSWRGTSSHIAGRFEELVVDLYEPRFIELADVQLTQQWLLALEAVNYAFPRLVTPTAAATIGFN